MCFPTRSVSYFDLYLISYRAVVIESQEGHGTSTVLFVDYGTTEKVTNSSLKVLPPALRSQPRLAFKCNSQQESILKMPKEFFAEQVDSKELTVIIEGDSEPYSILIPELDGGCSLIGTIMFQNYYFWQFFYQTRLDNFSYPQPQAMFEKETLVEFASTARLVFLLQKLLI